MDLDLDSPSRKTHFAVSLETLREFREDCVAVARTPTGIHLLLGDFLLKGLQRFRVVRILRQGSRQTVSDVHVFEGAWRSPALMRFKAVLERLPGGYEKLGFLRTEDMIDAELRGRTLPAGP